MTDELIRPNLKDNMDSIRIRNAVNTGPLNKEGLREREFNEALKTWTRNLTVMFNEHINKK